MSAIPRRTIIEPVPGALIVNGVWIELDGKKAHVEFLGGTLHVDARRSRNLHA